MNFIRTPLVFRIFTVFNVTTADLPQEGSDVFQPVPSEPQVAVAAPSIVKPMSQVYVAVIPSADILMLPLDMAPG